MWPLKTNVCYLNSFTLTHNASDNDKKIKCQSNHGSHIKNLRVFKENDRRSICDFQVSHNTIMGEGRVSFA